MASYNSWSYNLAYADGHLLYVSELFDIVSEFSFTSHAYADDTHCISVYQRPRARKQLNASLAALNAFAIGWPVIAWS